MADPNVKLELFELNNGTMKVLITNLDRTNTSVSVPGKDGKLEDVVLGFDSVEPYQVNQSLELPYKVSGFSSYCLRSRSCLTSFALAGHKSGNILDHTVLIWANHITPVDSNTIPTGEIRPVKGTPFDFTLEKRVGECIHEVGLFYDHNYVLDCGEEKSELKHAAKVKDPASGRRVLNLWTIAPGMQFYTGNYVNGVAGKRGAVYGEHAGLSLETQGFPFPNAINQPNFHSVVVHGGEKYRHSMLFEFSLVYPAKMNLGNGSLLHLRQS